MSAASMWGACLARSAGLGGFALATAVIAGCPVLAQAAGSDGTPGTVLDPVVVTGAQASYAAPEASTATRSPSPLLDTPQSVQVLDRTLLDDQDRRTLGDALVNVSGVVAGKTEETLWAQPIVRGFPSEIYIDGLPAYGVSAVADPASLINVERIEVAKGPSATLYGGGIGAPLGGMINLVSKQPGVQPAAALNLRQGSFGTFDPSIDLNVPLSSDGSVLSRLTGEFQKAHSHIDRISSEHAALNPTLRLSFDGPTDVVVGAQLSRIRQLEYSGLPAAITVAGPALADPTHFSGASDGPQTSIENQLYSVALNHRFSDTLRGHLAGRYYASDFHEYGSFAYPSLYPPVQPTQYPVLTGFLPTRTRESTVDGDLLFQASGLGLKHEVVVGATCDRTHYDAALGINYVPVGIIDYANPASDVAFGAVTTPDRFQRDRYQTAAAYLQDQATLADAVHLLAGIRYTRLAIEEQYSALDKTYTRLTPRLGVSVDLANGVAAFAGYAQGFRGTLKLVSATPPEPETSRSLEAGIKLAARDAGVSGTLAVFDLQRQKVPSADASRPFFSIQTGEQRARGAEADVIWEPSPALSMLANAAYTKAQVTADTLIPVGSVLPRVPRSSGRLAGRYRVLGGGLGGLAVGAGVTAVAQRQITLPNTATAPGYAVVDAQANFSFGRYVLGVSVVNLTGLRAYDPYDYLGQAVVIPIQTRSAYLTLGAQL